MNQCRRFCGCCSIGALAHSRSKFLPDKDFCKHRCEGNVNVVPKYMCKKGSLLEEKSIQTAVVRICSLVSTCPGLLFVLLDS